MDIQAELVSIGNELLSGRTLNTHGQDLGGALAAIGLQLVRDTTIPDDIPTIQQATKEALKRTPLVFVSGGLGPTVDDITRDALAGLLLRKLELHQPSVDAIARRFEIRGYVMNEAAERQAIVLEGSSVLPNSAGCAPGQRIELPEGRTLFVLPGPPHEFNAILKEEIIPWLQMRFSDARPKLVRIVATKGIGESSIVTVLENTDFQADGVDLGFYPAMGKVEIRLTAPPENEKQVTEAEKTLRHLFAAHLDPDVQ